MEPRPKPDLALLSLGWERDAETDMYRLKGATKWISLTDARLAAKLTAPKEPLPPVEPTIVELLTAILAALNRIEHILKRQPYGE
jgi:hypothetical protein